MTQQKNTADMPSQEKTPPSEETKDLNLAVYIQGIKKRKMKHRKYGKTLYFRFQISKAEMTQFKEDYVNSDQAVCDAIRRNLFQILNED